MRRIRASRDGRSPLHGALGVLAILAIVAMTVVTPSWGKLQRPAVVRAEEVFAISSMAPGRYLCSLRSHREAGGSALVRQRLIEFERNDLVELELDPAIVTGVEIEAGQPLAVVRSLRNEHRLQQLLSERDAQLAQRSLIEAGGLPADVEAAKKRVAVAQAERESALAELERARLLAEAGLISDAEFDVLQSKEEVCRLEVESSLAEVEVARDAARPEVLRAVDADVAALEANINELLRLAEERVVRSPIAGVARIGALDSEVEVHSIETVFLAIPVPGIQRTLVSLGLGLRFVPDGADHPVGDGVIVDIGAETVVVGGQPMFWASAEIDNRGPKLVPGTSGVAEILIDSKPSALFSTLMGIFP